MKLLTSTFIVLLVLSGSVLANTSKPEKVVAETERPSPSLVEMLKSAFALGFQSGWMKTK